MSAGEWHFREMGRGDVNIDPFEGEFFTTEALGNSITDALIREAIQNALDAASGDEPVRVRVQRLGPRHGRGARARQRYLGQLWPHLEASRSLAMLPSDDEPFDFLTIEDFGTRGLEGDPRQFEDRDDDDRDGDGDGSRNDFFYFWRNIGRSQKSEGDRGRWGLGKTVFQAASRIHSFFGLSVRRSDLEATLMGQSVLSIHRHAATRYAPYGYFGEPADDEGFVRPITDEESTAHFRETFAITREREPGLSVVIPFPDEKIDNARLIRSVIHHYFYPILRGRLVVEVTDGHERARLDAGSINAYAKRVAGTGRKRDLGPMLALARWAVETGDAPTRLQAPATGRRPQLSEELFEAAALDKLRQAFDDGRRIALDVPVTIGAGGGDGRNGNTREAAFRLVVERDERTAGEGEYVRQGITVANATTRRPRAARWLLIAEEASIANFLGDAENPAHTEWQFKSPKFKDKYRLGPSTLSFVKSAPAKVVAILSRPAKGRDENLLTNVFSVPDAESVLAGAMPARSADWAARARTIPEKPAPGPGKGSALKLARVQKGFRLTLGRGNEVPRRVLVELAYEVRRGNAFNRYVPLDFRVEEKPIAVAVTDGRIERLEANRIEAAVEGADFALEAHGFDPHRDLRVRIRPREEAT